MRPWVLALAVLLMAGAWLVRRARQRGAMPASPPDPHHDDLDVGLDAVFAEVVGQRDELIASRLEQVVVRQVPVRKLEAVPELHTVRLCFADGTRVFGKGAHPGDLGVLCMMLRTHQVCPTRARRDAAGNHLVLSVEGRREPVDVLITGLDQPD